MSRCRDVSRCWVYGTSQCNKGEPSWQRATEPVSHINGLDPAWCHPPCKCYSTCGQKHGGPSCRDVGLFTWPNPHHLTSLLATRAGQIKVACPCIWYLPPAQGLFFLETNGKEVKAEKEKQMFPKIQIWVRKQSKTMEISRRHIGSRSHSEGP